MWVPGKFQKAPATGPPQHMPNVCWQPCALVPPSASSHCGLMQRPRPSAVQAAGNGAAQASPARHQVQVIQASFARSSTGALHCAGSARTVNRRYVAMFVAKKDRTWASSLFVSLSAVGMAAGPLLSLPLSHIGSTRLLGGDPAPPAPAWAAAPMWFVGSVSACLLPPGGNMVLHGRFLG